MFKFIFLLYLFPKGESAIFEKTVPLEFTDIETLEVEGQPSVKITWQSKPNRNYLIFYSLNLEDWEGIAGSGIFFVT
ncbi:MAG: hypothetical protein OSA93_15700 [Akkermansiaceae bacterium]|nr:hypothetical protein [Akkermansiaceae bacterium]